MYLEAAIFSMKRNERNNTWYTMRKMMFKAFIWYFDRQNWMTRNTYLGNQAWSLLSMSNIWSESVKNSYLMHNLLICSKYSQLPLSDTPSWATVFPKNQPIRRCCSKLSLGRPPALAKRFEKTQRVLPTRELTVRITQDILLQKRGMQRLAGAEALQTYLHYLHIQTILRQLKKSTILFF